MIMFIPTIPGPYYVGTNLTLRCTVTLYPDYNNYEHINTWMSGPFYSDDNATPIRRSQGRYIRIDDFSCISDQHEGSYTCRAGLIDNPDVEANATINIEILGMCTFTSYLNQILYTILNRSTISCCIHNTNQWTANCRTILLPHLLCSDTNNNSLYMDRYE